MAHPFCSHTPTLDTPAVSDTADQAPLTTERDAASLLKRPPAPTTKQVRAAARAQANAARLARRKALAEQRRRRGPVIPSFGLRGPGGCRRGGGCSFGVSGHHVQVCGLWRGRSERGPR